MDYRNLDEDALDVLRDKIRDDFVELAKNPDTYVDYVKWAKFAAHINSKPMIAMWAAMKMAMSGFNPENFEKE